MPPRPSLPSLALLALSLWMSACDAGESSHDGKQAASTGGTASGSGGQSSSSGGMGGDPAPGDQGVCDPSGATAMVSLTYDDALPSQLANAVPALDAHGLSGTFFLTNVGSSSSWAALAGEGHELAAHTLNHPCPKVNTWVSAGNANEDYDLARMAGELDDNVAQLLALGQSEPLTFAYPCGIDWVGEAHDSYVGLLEERFTAARGVSGGLVTSLADAYHVPAYFLTGSGDSLIAVVEQAKAASAWVVFGFHGVGGDHTPVAKEDHEALLAYLEAQGQNVRVLPFGAAVECMKQR